MRIVMFYHSLVSDWNHGNAHFLRGVVRDLTERGHDVRVYEPAAGWSRANLVRQHGQAALAAFRAAYPRMASQTYDPADLDLDRVLAAADVAVVHEWNDPGLVARIGEYKRRHDGFALLFHDTHHRAVTAPNELAGLNLKPFDGVLAFGESLRRLYLERRWTHRAWTWHEAADARLFHPFKVPGGPTADVVWVGNWGDEQRMAELREFLFEPLQALKLRATIYGVAPSHAAADVVHRHGSGRDGLGGGGCGDGDALLRYAGWIANVRVPRAFAEHRATVHVPRQPYVDALPGIPTIRMFEALACGIPLICSPWQDREGLFGKGRDYLQAADGAEMQRLLQRVLDDADLARSLAEHGRQTIVDRHTCAHRVDELLAICRDIGLPTETELDLDAEFSATDHSGVYGT